MFLWIPLTDSKMPVIAMTTNYRCAWPSSKGKRGGKGWLSSVPSDGSHCSDRTFSKDWNLNYKNCLRCLYWGVLDDFSAPNLIGLTKIRNGTSLPRGFYATGASLSLFVQFLKNLLMRCQERHYFQSYLISITKSLKTSMTARLMCADFPIRL